MVWVTLHIHYANCLKIAETITARLYTAGNINGRSPSEACVKGAEILGHVAEGKCTTRASMFSDYVLANCQAKMSPCDGSQKGAASGSECGEVYASGGSSPERRAAPVLLCLRR